MYDKIRLWAARTRATPDVSSFLDKAKEQIDHETGEVCVFGCLDGLKVCIYTGGISITGSLAKYLYPNNIYPLNRHITVQAIEKLSESLHLCLDEAKVTGLEFGTQFVMKHPVESYLSKLGDAPRLARYHFDVGSLYYKPRGKQQIKVFAFYDKQADATAKGMVLPDGFEGANLLKYELRLNGRLPQQMGLSKVKASTLSDRDFYRSLMKLYQNSYYSIKKNVSLKTNAMGEIKNVSDAFDVFVARMINQSGQTFISDFVEECKEAKVFDDRKNYYRLKKKIEEVSAKADISVSDELVKELDNEIMNVGAYI